MIPEQFEQVASLKAKIKFHNQIMIEDILTTKT